MVFTSSFISQQVQGQLQMFGAQSQYSQQMSGSYPGMPQMMPPMMPQMTPMAAARGGAGMYGEQVASRMSGAGGMAMAMGGLGMSMMPGIPNIMSGAWGGAQAGYAMAGGGAMGLAGGAVGLAAGALPFYAGAKAIGAYTGAFSGGMQDQAGLNSVLRNNFQQFNGGGAFSRGFSQNQMGQIGSTVGGMAKNNPFTSMGELNSLIGQGAEAGMFTAVRDVQQFTSRFKKMIDTLSSIQKELGGSLTDAMSFVKGSQQVGIFRAAGQANFAAEIRNASATTGMTSDQLMGLGQTGAQISRAFGGAGRQGAMGAVRAAGGIGAAIQSGVLSQEALSEATGGLTGSDAIQAFSSRMMQHTGQFSRTAMGRYSLFSLSNKGGTGLDAEMLERFKSGDISVSEVSKRAHQNVGRMGRAKAINSEGSLRGSLMEEGGMSAQIGMMRLAIGDRVMDQGDDLAQLVMQRRFKMSKSESEIMTNLMRNQGRIANEEGTTSMMSKREASLRQDVNENRSVEGFMKQLEHGLSDATGLTRVREAGRSFVTKISSTVERAMNNFLGIAASSLNGGDNAALSRLAMGQASDADVARLKTTTRSGSVSTGADVVPMSQQILRGLGMHTNYRSNAEVMSSRGVADTSENRALAELASQGSLRGAGDIADMGKLSSSDRTISRLSESMFMSGGDMGRFQQRARGATGASSNAISAYMNTNGLGSGGLVPNSISAGIMGGGRSREDAASFIRGGGQEGADLIARSNGYGKRLSDEERKIMEGFAAGDTDAMSGFLGSEGVQSAVHRMQGMSGDKKGLNLEIDALERTSKIDASTESGKAALSAFRQMRRGVSKNGALGAEFSAGSSERDEEIRARFREQRSEVFKVQSGMSGQMSKNWGSVLAAYDDEQGGAAGIRTAIGAQVDRMSDSAYRKTDEYMREAEQLGGSEFGRGILRGASQQHAFMRDVTGKGRRGRSQANETALGAITGDMFNQLGVTTEGGRTMNANQVMERLRGTRDSDEKNRLLRQMTEGLVGQGVTNASALVQEFGKMATGGIDADEAKRLHTMAGDEKLQAARANASAALQAARDPLGTERNQLLQKILEKLPSTPKEWKPGDMSPGST